MRQRGVRLYVGGHAHSVQGERYNLAAERMFSAANPPNAHGFDPRTVDGLLDSGAFSDAPHERLTAAEALTRQLRWERQASRLWGPWQASGIVSYDLLIDETWTDGTRHKRRWSVRDAERAVRETVDHAAYLTEHRAALAPRTLILSCQGVDPLQYAECAAAVLQRATPDDWVGLGGWCVLGRWTTLLPSFWATLRLVLPMTALAGVRHVHVFGVLYLPALGGLLWLADRYGLEVSTDSTAPVLSCVRSNARKAGVRVEGWRANVAWWKDTLANLRSSGYYREPPDIAPARQLSLLEAA